MVTTSPPTDMAALLDPAQADAERFHGAGPATDWQPARGAHWTGIAVLALVAAAAVSWIFLGSAPDVIETPRAIADARLAPPATPPAPRIADSTLPEERVISFAPIAPNHPLAMPPTRQPADPDAWALDPRQIIADVVAPSGTSWLRLHNTPAPTQEAESAAADESEPDMESGGGHEE